MHTKEVALEVSNGTVRTHSWGETPVAKAKVTLNGKDLIMLLLYVPGFRSQKLESISGRTRITKIIFLFEKEVWPRFKFNEVITQEDLPDFRPYHFGPFSSDVFSDIEFLKNLKLLKITIEQSEQPSEEEALEYKWWLEEVDVTEEEPGDYQTERFELTPLGVSFVEQRLLPRLKPEQYLALAELKARCNGISLKTLLRYVYSKYEETTTNSKIRDEIMENDGPRNN